MRTPFHDRSGPRWQLAAVFVLVVLIAVLGTFQYRWLGEVSNAERERMRAGLQTRTSDFTQAFDRELTQIYLAFNFGPDVANSDAAAAIASGLARLQASADAPGLIKDVFLHIAEGSPEVLFRFDAATQTLQPAEWPAALEAWRLRATHGAPPNMPGMLPLLMADAVDATAPALIIPRPFTRKFDAGGGRVAVVSDPSSPARALIVWLDADRLRQRLLEPLVARYFGAGEASEYLVSIVPRNDPAHVVYASAKGALIDERSADATAGLFDLRINELAGAGTSLHALVPGDATTRTDRVAITVVRRSSGPGDAARALMTGGPGQGAWLVRARYRSGSLESIVASSRRKNMAISLGVLGLLCAAFMLVIAASQRQRRLAQQQMEFVASVSHELRTPLAVICSAGENLADGVVSDGAQVKTYGALIETEGRRLGDMVERVLRFAGINSGHHTQVRAAVDLARVIADAVHGVAGEARERGVVVNVHPHAALPTTLGDVDALKSAVQNVVGNAVKYSVTGGNVDVTVDVVENHFLKLRVTDRGIGIDAADLPQVFTPFFRGRRAVDAQVRGSGIGLSVVRHVVQSHGGDVRVESAEGEGTTVTIVLPVVLSADPSVVVRVRPRAAL